MKILPMILSGIMFTGAANAISSICNDGYYSGMYGCVKCPDDYPRSKSNNTDGITSCFKADSVRSTTNYSIYENRCYYNSHCTNVFISCLDGYYDAGNASTTMTCTAVGQNYYSSSPSSRLRCPVYYYNGINNTFIGLTTGTNAAAITDCYIPTGQNFTDTTGTFSYTSKCSYTR